MAVTDYLKRDDVAAERITTAYYGETEPKHSNDTAEGRAKNRRVEIAIFASEELREEAKKNTQ
jgi:outer membrane protein OmpA-like peptidoglycan-associated protein